MNYYYKIHEKKICQGKWQDSNSTCVYLQNPDSVHTVVRGRGRQGIQGKGSKLFCSQSRTSQIKLHADAPHKHTHHPTRVQGEQQESDSAATLSGDRSDEDDAQQVS